MSTFKGVTHSGTFASIWNNGKCDAPAKEYIEHLEWCISRIEGTVGLYGENPFRDWSATSIEALAQHIRPDNS